MSSDYKQFLASKRVYTEPAGFEVDPRDLLPQLKPFQRDSVGYMLRIGRGAAFQECGLGKTLQQLEYAYWVVKKFGGIALIVCPLAVASQTLREDQKFGITRDEVPIGIYRAGDEIPFTTGIAITNYEKLKHFENRQYVAVIPDESSILKSFNGKTKQRLCNQFAHTPYKLACTATPSPNDLMELGNHSEFLGAMRSSEMLMRWFINDTAHVGKYRLKGHAEEDYWRWVTSWAICLASPADLGYDDSDYVLPPLNMHDHVVDVDDSPDSGSGLLFNNCGITATTVHAEKRKSVRERAEVVAGLVRNSTETWVVWCDTDYEADALYAAINLCDECVEVRGSQPDYVKEHRIDMFSTQQARVIITKPRICGFGINWQHCHNTAFVGVSYSFEQFYQAIRRLWRFGQSSPVNAHIVNSQAEQVIWRTVRKKQDGHVLLQSKMAAAMKEFQLELVRGIRDLQEYAPAKKMKLPNFLKTKA